MFAAGGDTMVAPGSLELCAKPKTVKNAQPTTTLSRDRLIQVFTVCLDAAACPEGSLEIDNGLAARPERPANY
jgi:hypothetical protein